MHCIIRNINYQLIYLQLITKLNKYFLFKVLTIKIDYANINIVN